MVSDVFSSLPEQEMLRDPEMNRLARLALLSGAMRTKGFKPEPLKELKHAFRSGLQGLLSTPDPLPAYRTNRVDVPDHYSCILNLTSALEWTSSEDASVQIARAIRDEAGALCDAYFRRCEHILDVWGGCIDRK